MHDPPSPDDSLPTRFSLLERVKDLDDARSWDEFFHRYRDLVRHYARRRGLREHEVEEVAQEVFERIARTIHDFHPEKRTGSFRSWLGRLTGWRSRDKLRERAQIPPPPDGAVYLEDLPAPPDPGLEFESEARRHLLGELFRRLAHQIPPRQMQIFHLLVVEQLPAARVATLFSLNIAHVYVLKHRVMRKLQAEATRMPEWSEHR